jgi:membrane-associated phospholipid phosphatase
MHVRVVSFLVLALLAAPSAGAQTEPAAAAPAVETREAPAGSTLAPAEPEGPEALEPSLGPAGAPERTSFVHALGRDFRNFFTTDTAKTIGAIGAGALIASQWDAGARAAGATWSDDAFEPGKLAGNFLTQVAAGGGAYLFGRVTGHDRIAALGNDLMRAQILSQTIVQAAKLTTNRNRPDGSNDHSLPSGHAASAFASAGVIQRHFGWKAGIPAYAVAGYVGASRMAADRHYLSDVILGAGVGLAAAHTVTLGIGAQRFSVGVAPSPGGAAVTISRRPAAHGSPGST